MKPLLRYAGGKSWAESYVRELLTEEDLHEHVYLEPFCGSAALALALQPNKVILNDLNIELINMYEAVRKFPKSLISRLQLMQDAHSSEHYYTVRAWDRDPEDFARMNSVAHAARFIYLNKTGFNGLYRVNLKGFCNTPIGRTSSGKTPDIVQEASIKEISEYLETHAELYNKNYLEITAMANPGDIVILDPPYDYEDQKGFVGYTTAGWTRNDLVTLKNECDRLAAIGCKFILFNNNTSFVKELFSEYTQDVLLANRNINCKGNKRSKVEEVAIRNF